MSLKIEDYPEFQKVCDVKDDGSGGWWYQNINEELMYSTHRSWLYCIVVNGIIFKIGETGNPLGIAQQQAQEQYDNQTQPITGSQSRLGRYRKMQDATDGEIRKKLIGFVEAEVVSIYAKKCEIIIREEMIRDQKIQVHYASHKDQEIAYLDFIKNSVGIFPMLNQCRK